MPRRTALAAAAACTCLAIQVGAQAPNTFKIIGDAGVSAQQIYVASNKVYIVDKTENNTAQVAGHPAWASEYDLTTNTARAMDVVTNSFCAGGTILGNGTIINIGGNQAVTADGQPLQPNPEGTGPYQDYNGGFALRLLDPCAGNDTSCQWYEKEMAIQAERWYPTLETLQDGSSIIIGGDMYGGFVNQDSQSNPSVEYFPSKGNKLDLTFLNDTMPANLYPLVWLVPSGKLFMQANWGTQLYDWQNNIQIPLPNITKAIKTYPASGATAMLPMSSANNWTAPIVFCGGADYASGDWAAHSTLDPTLSGTAAWAQLATQNAYFRSHPNSQSCVQMTPDDATPTWTDNDDMLEPRVMGQFIYLPDGRLFLLNGISDGVAGYDNNSLPYGTGPIYAPAYFNPTAPAGSRWTRNNLQNASLPHLYHSTASLLLDGSIMSAGSNPYRDFQRNGSNLITDSGAPPMKAEFWSETRLEVFYPDYWNKSRPAPTNMPTTFSYGGKAQNISLSAADIAGVTNASQVTAVLIRPGFSTHAINFGQRMLVLDSALVANGTGATLVVAPVYPNAAILAPGPSFFFVVVNGVPSMGVEVMIGNGQLGTQPLARYPQLPASSTFAASASSSGSSTAPVGVATGQANNKTSGSIKYTTSTVVYALLAVAGLLMLA